MNEVTVSVRFDHLLIGVAHAYNIKVPDILVRTYEPQRITDLHEMKHSGEVMKGSDSHEMIIEARKHAAKVLADELAHFLYQDMCKNDTMNGYRVKQVD